MDLHLDPHEETFPIKPVGVKYKCEFCGVGEQVVDPDCHSVIMTNPPLIQHKCTYCGKIMNLPKQYPRVEWVKED